MSQLLKAAVFVSPDFKKSGYDIKELRGLCIAQLLTVRRKFRRDWGELVLCFDSTNVWRKKLFPYYKLRRQKDRDESHIDWDQALPVLAQIETEMIDYLPYIGLKIKHLEADDIIAVLARHISTKPKPSSGIFDEEYEKVLIISSDKDFKQLHTSHIKQYSKMDDRWVSVDSPADFLTELVLKGDPGDGVPNILSPDDHFTRGERAKPMTEKKIEDFKKNGLANFPPECAARLERNKLMVDMGYIPEFIQDLIVSTYIESQPNPRNKLMTYFVGHDLSRFTENLTEF